MVANTLQMTIMVQFSNQQPAYAHGVEYGRLLERMERGDLIISNNGFPVRVENVDNLRNTCEKYGYIASFGMVHYNEWVDFTGVKKVASAN